MKQLLLAALTLAAMSSAAFAQPLTDTQLDNVTAGAATASLTITNLSASGPTSATATASDVNVVASVIGGLTPSSTATVSGTFTANAE